LPHIKLLRLQKKFGAAKLTPRLTPRENTVGSALAQQPLPNGLLEQAAFGHLNHGRAEELTSGILNAHALANHGLDAELERRKKADMDSLLI
jgi:hypothetical protein